jgi:addiction module HigA family antidote
MPRDIPLPHPGVVLREEFLEPIGLSVYALAQAIHVTRSWVNDICLGRSEAKPPSGRAGPRRRPVSGRRAP